MLPKYLYIAVLCSAIIFKVNSADEDKQAVGQSKDSNALNGNRRATLHNLMKDSFTSLKQIRHRNFSMTEITFKDDSSIKFHNITRLPCTEYMRTIFKCILNETLKLFITFGCYEVNGSIETSTDDTIHPFKMVLYGVDMEYAIQYKEQPKNHNISEQIEIVMQYYKITNQFGKNASSILYNRLIPMIKSQLLDIILAQIKTEDLQLYSSTARKHCFDSSFATAQTLFINQSNVEPRVNNFTIDWIQINNLSLSFYFSLDDWENEMILYSSFDTTGCNGTLGYHFVDDNVNVKKSGEYDFKIRYLRIDAILKAVSRNVTVYTTPEITDGEKFITEIQTKLLLQDKLKKIIQAEMESFLRQSYSEI